jgi:hypothetical protein
MEALPATQTLTPVIPESGKSETDLPFTFEFFKTQLAPLIHKSHQPINKQHKQIYKYPRWVRVERAIFQGLDTDMMNLVAPKKKMVKQSLNDFFADPSEWLVRFLNVYLVSQPGEKKRRLYMEGNPGGGYS